MSRYINDPDNERPVTGNGIKYLPNRLLLGSKYAERQRVQTVQFPTEVARPPPLEDESSSSDDDEEDQPAQVEDEVEDEVVWIPGDELDAFVLSDTFLIILFLTFSPSRIRSSDLGIMSRSLNIVTIYIL
jgi:hypothetical protein